MHRRWMKGSLALLLCLVSTLAMAQVPNPTLAEFTPSPDHAALVASYELGWFAVGATDPVSVVDIGKPAPDAQNLCRVSIYLVRPAVGTFTAQIRALGNDGSRSVWSGPSNTFSAAPTSTCALTWTLPSAGDLVRIYAVAGGVPTLVGAVPGNPLSASVSTASCSVSALMLTRVAAGVESALFAPTTAVPR